MTEAQFRESLQSAAPPVDLSLPLQALWHDARNDWTRAHDTVQDDESPAGAWVHAYLHRKEGDRGNARYWYDRAGQNECHAPLEEEWQAIVRALLADAQGA